jgi:hypothetical protein
VQNEMVPARVVLGDETCLNHSEHEMKRQSKGGIV